MSINGDCIYCGGHSTDEEWDTWNGECQWCGEFDAEWEKKDGSLRDDAEDDTDDFDLIDKDDYGWDPDDDY